MRFPVRFGAVLVSLAATSASAQTPSPQFPAPPPPQPGFATPPTPERAPAPAAPRAPAPPVDTGEIEQTTRARGAAIVNNGGVVIYQSPGVSAPNVTPAAMAAPRAALPPIPPSLMLAAARRLAGATYYAVTGRCPTPSAPAPNSGGFATPPAEAPRPAAPQQPQEVVVRVVHEQAYAPAPAASPQTAPAPRHWSLFHR